MGVESIWSVRVVAGKTAYRATVKIKTHRTGYFFGSGATPLEAVEAALLSMRNEKRRYNKGRTPDNYRVARDIRP